MKERIKSIKLDGLSRAYKFSYDNGGNILKKETYYITNGTISTTPTKTDISRYGSPIVETILKRGAKYIKEFIQPTLKSSAVSGGISAISNVVSHYAQVLMEYIG